jgi:hypothetical protein
MNRSLEEFMPVIDTSRSGLAAIVDRIRESPLVAGKPPEPELIGECWHCHYALERKQVKQGIDILRVPMGEPMPASIILMTYWACTNERCCLMFWRLPENREPQLTPYAEEVDGTH